MYLINKAVEKVALTMQTLDVKDPVWSLHRDYLSALRDAAFAKFVEKRLEIAVQHFLRKPKSSYLQNGMKDIILLRKNELFVENPFKVFMKEVGKQTQDF